MAGGSYGLRPAILQHDATVGQRGKAIYPFVAFELQKRRHNELVYQTLFQTAPADAHL
jgi:hypothetical protein